MTKLLLFFCWMIQKPYGINLYWWRTVDGLIATCQCGRVDSLIIDPQQSFRFPHASLGQPLKKKTQPKPYVVGLPSFFYCSCYLFSLCWPLTFPIYAAVVSLLHSWRFLSPEPLISWVTPSFLLVTMHEMFSCVYSRLLTNLPPHWK